MVRSISRVTLAVAALAIGCVPVAPVADQPATHDEPNVECRSNAECDDGLFCNGREKCPGIRCVAGDPPCGNGACNEAGNVCVADEPEPDCTNDSQCQDGAFCNGREECISGACYLGDRPCGNDACDEVRNQCQADEPEPDCTSDAECQDGVFCNGRERCAQGVCSGGSSPCGDDLCDEPTASCVPRFISGDVFSFLSVDETEFFNAEVAARVQDIDDAVEQELADTLFDLYDRGIGCSTATLGAKCDAEISKVELKRAATFDALEYTAFVLGSRFVPFSLEEVREIESFNCAKYPNRVFVVHDDCSLSATINCEISLPCMP